MRLQPVQFFLLAIALLVSPWSIFAEASAGGPARVAEVHPPKNTRAADLRTGEQYAISFVDVDGHKFSTVDGHVTLMVIATLADVDKACTVGDRIPGHCLGNPAYRMITVLSFEKKRSRPVRMILSALVRRRLDAEAKRLQPRYTANKLTHNPRNDVLAVADFDGTISSKLRVTADSPAFQVLVFGKNGELLQRWSDVPATNELAAVVK